MGGGDAALVVLWAGVASAAVYEVGNMAGWTGGNPDYAAWASSNKFHVGDTVVFTYNRQFHNVLAVGKAGYRNCDATKPTAAWSVLNTTGHHYFLCGFPGHCAAGQRVDIRVASSAAPSSGSPSGGATAAPSPHPNAAPKALSATSVAAAVATSLLSLVAAVSVLAV